MLKVNLKMFDEFDKRHFIVDNEEYNSCRLNDASVFEWLESMTSTHVNSLVRKMLWQFVAEKRSMSFPGKWLENYPHDKIKYC